MKKEKTIDFHLKWTWHTVSRMYNTYASAEDMTMSIGYVLLNIDLENGTPATKIGPSIGMEARSLTRMLKALEDKGWVYRAIDPDDKRFVKVYLTELGKQKRQFAREGVINFNTTVTENVKPEHLAIFFHVLKQINELIENDSNQSKLQLQKIENEV
ncbi:MAG: MarR family winged helix-turn-helix transcriptional regulator [Leadbetterella sp.]